MSILGSSTFATCWPLLILTYGAKVCFLSAASEKEDPLVSLVALILMEFG